MKWRQDMSNRHPNWFKTKMSQSITRKILYQLIAFTFKLQPKNFSSHKSIVEFEVCRAENILKHIFSLSLGKKYKIVHVQRLRACFSLILKFKKPKPRWHAINKLDLVSARKYSYNQHVKTEIILSVKSK